MRLSIRQSDNKSIKNLFLRAIHVTLLVFTMMFIGSMTFYASVNSYEVITRNDIPYSDVISGVKITNYTAINSYFIDKLNKPYDTGSFGIPKKIKLPEANKHIGVVGAVYDKEWKASKGVGQTFILDNKRQKMFGQAVIYLQKNTPTTHDLGEVFSGDIVNIVTSEGWQLGYQIKDLSDDPAKLNLSGQSNVSEIIVILIDDNTGELLCFRAILTKVGERI